MDVTDIDSEAWKAMVAEAYGDDRLLPAPAATPAIREGLAASVEDDLETCPGAVGVLFSGGIDSSALAWLLKRKGRAVRGVGVGTVDGRTIPEDLSKGREAARLLDLPYRQIRLAEDAMAAELAKTAQVLGTRLATVVNVTVGTVERLGIEAFARQGIKDVFSGLGSEELFAGYERHAKAADVREACREGLLSMYKRDLLRLMLLSKRYGVRILLPFLSEEMIRLSARLPAEEMIRDGVKKHCLREAFAAELPETIVRRPKRAAQYGSRTDRLLSRLARKAGCRTKQEYVQRLAAGEEQAHS